MIIQAVAGAAGLVGGLLLAARPDGSLLDAKRSALDGTPFSDWRAPGILLALLVGCGLLGASVWVWRRWPGGRGVALASAAGLVAFEVVQVLLIGFQGLQLLIGAIGTLRTPVVTTSTAAVARQPNSSLRIEQLELAEIRPNENRVRLVASGVCHADALVREGIVPTPLPAVLGHEGDGI